MNLGGIRKMKKIVIGTLAATIVLGASVGLGAINHGHAEEDRVKVKTEQGNQVIGVEKAASAALERVNGTVESVDLDNDNGKTYYEVEIEKDHKEFEVDVDAYSAQILNVEEGYNDDDGADDRDERAATSAKASFISEEQAIAIAKKIVNGEVIEIERDEDDGRYEYEIKLRTNQGEAEITIDAATGTVLEQEFDGDDDGDDD
jgi:uncharacterized membrane protein YkoI